MEVKIPPAELFLAQGGVIKGPEPWTPGLLPTDCFVSKDIYDKICGYCKEEAPDNTVTVQINV